MKYTPCFAVFMLAALLDLCGSLTHTFQGCFTHNCSVPNNNTTQQDANVWIFHVMYFIIWGVLCQKQVSKTGTSNYITQYLWDVITCPCPWYLFLAQYNNQCTQNHEISFTVQCYRINIYHIPWNMHPVCWAMFCRGYINGSLRFE